MGILDRFRFVSGIASRPDYLASPWAEGALSSVVWSDVFGTDHDVPMGRGDALAIPAVSKGINLLKAMAHQVVLENHNKAGRLEAQSAFLTNTPNLYSAQWRLAATFEDLALYGACVWLTKRGADGWILSAERCDPSRWKITNGNLMVDDEDVEPSQVLYIPGYTDGLLNLASRTLRGARDQEDGWTRRARNPVPVMELHMTDDSELTPKEAQEVVNNWATARRNADGAVGLTPKGIELRTHGDLKTDLYVEGRNAVRTDVGSFLGISTASMDASLSTASLTYSTQEGTRSQIVDYTLPLWLGPVESRLSLDDVVPHGQYVRGNITQLVALTAGPTGTPTED